MARLRVNSQTGGGEPTRLCPIFLPHILTASRPHFLNPLGTKTGRIPSYWVWCINRPDHPCLRDVCLPGF
jgi:hypothetical protein